MSVSPLEHTAIGALGGSVEVLLMQPMVAFKNALQEGRPIPTSPAHLYRGLSMNVLSMAPITASQFGAHRLTQQLLLGKADGEVTGAQRFISAGVAGAVSALIACPSELIIIQQQRTGRPLMAEATAFFSAYKLPSIYRGLTCAIGREGLYASGYLGLFPVLQAAMHKQGYSPSVSLVVSGLAAGTFGAVASHPFDTAKTRMQAFMYTKPEYMTMASSFAAIYKEGGITTFWKGIAPRMARIICATFILNYIRTNSVDYLENARKE
mmetsp:Transcript_8894/g.15419  ORF Transcript_8894/g.15419 Transcript_8894/m.15419 type:complete len:266 (-) Transcript_8894:416-1213(-)|eukprot:CAMPEP_0119102028 /NCGR_PEP_ID=MMETSP1180-20130426/905_1 /TAXON_ID=3052 ORGANISM="Chlamydomonas cf sp, Strain CCMP681" /NCGR_SAMPLE_ID=MMETSP1180 /ASSEMBLY_ACC=CAM_ASM_000741 /LENGTH=265 /DNA_ID=CAMNT_0007086241 /DNA_START=124 /DNA_END=921 /DNA_ORIENTATION=+